MNIQSTPSERLFYAAHKERMNRMWPANVVVPPTRKPKPVLSVDPAQFRMAWEILDGKALDIEGMNQSQRIKATVAHYYGITMDDLVSHRRAAHLSRARQIAMYLARHTTTMTAKMFGRLLGDRDHTTVLHGIKKIEALLLTDKTLADDIDQLKRRLGAE